MASITKNHIPGGRPNRPKLYINPSCIVIHDADNLAAYADANFYANLLNTDDTALNSWHFTVDALGIVEHVPTDEMTLNTSTATDDPGNDTSISITICRNAGGNRGQAEQNALWLIRYLQALYSIPTKNVVPHRYFDQGADCPKLLLPRWDEFVRNLEQRDTVINPDRHLFIFDKSEIIRAVLTNGSPTACPYYDAVHKEQINGENTLEFYMPAQHEDTQYVATESLVAIKDLDEEFYQLFVVKEVEETHESTVYKRVFCEHAALELVDEIVEDRRPENETARNLLAIMLSGTRWEVGIVSEMGTVSQLNFYYESVLSGIHKIIDTFNCEVRYRVKLAGGKITGRYVDLLQSRGTNTGRRFQYTRDMKKVTRTADSTVVKTALYGRGKGEESGDGYGRRINFADVIWEKADGYPVDKPMGQEWVGDPDALATFGRINYDGTLRHRFGIYENEEQTDPEALLRETWEALQQNKTPLMEYVMDVVDLEKVTGYASEKVRLGDNVVCIDNEFNPPLSVEARVIELARHLDEPEKAEVKLGNFLPKVSDTLARLERVEKKINDKEGVWDSKVGTPNGYIDTLRAEVRAGQGTVKLSHHNGILITDNDYSPTKAMRLLGGVLAIANSKDLVTGEWNWTTFGTADGFTADLITAGTMSFDRARGGTLVLGGPGNGYGRLQVYNEGGDVIADLDARVGGFRELYVGKLTSNTIQVNYDNDIYYIDAVNGRDDNTGLDPSQPLRTIQKAIDKVPRFNFGVVTIQCAAGQTFYETIAIQGYYGSGQLAIELQGSVLNGNIAIHSNGMDVFLEDGIINDVPLAGELNGQAATVYVTDSRLQALRIDVNTNSLCQWGLLAASSYISLDRCSFYGAADVAVEAGEGSTVNITDCTGTAPTGLRADGPSIIAGGGTAPQGDTANTETINGGQITGVFTAEAGNENTKFESNTCIMGHYSTKLAVWNEYENWNGDYKGAIQGAWDNSGNHKSLYFLPVDFIKENWYEINPKSVLKCFLRLTRYAEGGYPKEEPLYLYMHNYTDIPYQGEPQLIFPIGIMPGLAWGEERWVEVPTWTLTQIINGNAKGFALYSPNGDHYAKYKEYLTYKAVLGL
ncbi:phage minor structural protein, N-terminal region [Desulfotomaculum arcticum]|uniref:N-acetylmuramoyl-L-alanine amidase n=1 Tax=Desulfotruncus arcticus DSM 17038 TaxID=1121424 RepID=A0A1I2YAV8_9FIRM|nr:phage tail spike protein [Desulfotruncus arcticus]SFH22898.1 phage minor structural protein, N-terminal region [Desulfotomaculum arcticum] [Desulfotruncus arcticus DSM 17038]